MADAIIVLSTLPDRSSGERIAQQLVAEGLAACAQLATAPITSFFHWQGEDQASEEWGLSLKAAPQRWHQLRDRLEQLHPYDTPQILCLDAVASDAYAQWLNAEASEEPT